MEKLAITPIWFLIVKWLVGWSLFFPILQCLKNGKMEKLAMSIYCWLVFGWLSVGHIFQHVGMSSRNCFWIFNNIVVFCVFLCSCDMLLVCQCVIFGQTLFYYAHVSNIIMVMIRFCHGYFLELLPTIGWANCHCCGHMVMSNDSEKIKK